VWHSVGGGLYNRHNACPCLKHSTLIVLYAVCGVSGAETRQANVLMLWMKTPITFQLLTPHLAGFTPAAPHAICK
jgi:hypothetical protein